MKITAKDLTEGQMVHVYEYGPQYSPTKELLGVAPGKIVKIGRTIVDIEHDMGRLNHPYIERFYIASGKAKEWRSTQRFFLTEAQLLDEHCRKGALDVLARHGLRPSDFPRNFMDRPRLPEFDMDTELLLKLADVLLQHEGGADTPVNTPKEN